MSNSIKVVARFRPQNRIEVGEGGQPIVEFESEDTCKLDVCILSLRGRSKGAADSMDSPKRPPGLLPSTACLI